MKTHNLSISLPAPCDEQWAGMTPTGCGRHCNTCQKTVVDFTVLTDGQIIDIFNKAKDNPPCGHFLETQLNRPLVDNRRKPSFISIVARRAAAFVFLLQSAAVASFAQQAKKATTVQHDKKGKPDTRVHHRQICGKVMGYESGKPIDGATVRIKGTTIDSLTDKTGMFVLMLPDTFNQASVVFEGSYVISDERNIIVEETMTADDIRNNKEVTLYSYQPVPLKSHDINTYNIREVKRYGGVPVRNNIIDVRRPTLWYKATKPFRKVKPH